MSFSKPTSTMTTPLMATVLPSTKPASTTAATASATSRSGLANFFTFPRRMTLGGAVVLFASGMVDGALLTWYFGGNKNDS